MDQRMPTDHDPGAAILLEAAHRTELCFQAAMIGLDAVVGVPIRAMPRCRQQLLPPDRVGRCPVGDDLDWLGTGRGDGPPKEAASGHPIASWGDELADDLACLVDRAVDVAPSAGDLHVGLVDLPAVPDSTPAGTSHLAEQWR